MQEKESHELTIIKTKKILRMKNSVVVSFLSKPSLLGPHYYKPFLFQFIFSAAWDNNNKYTVSMMIR